MSDLRAEREETLREFHDGTRSPLAAVERHDFTGDRPISFGAKGDVRLAGVDETITIRALADGFEVDGKRVGPSEKVRLGRYTLRLSHQNFPAVVVLDPENPRLAGGPFPRWFEPDPAFRVEARLLRAAKPEEVVIQSTRGNRRKALKVGQLEFAIHGKQQRLTATQLLEPGVKALSVFFRDGTTGQESYPVGRYVDPEPLDGDRYLIDFNRAYNPSCAFSPLYNCPIPPRENVLEVKVTAGERDPGGH